MSLIYSLVSKNSVILAEHSNASGNFGNVAQVILEKVPANQGKMTFVYDRYLFHTISKNGLVFLCMAEESAGRRVPFMFLEDIVQRFEAMYGTSPANVVAYGMNEFSKIMSQRIDFYENDPNADRIKRVQGEIDQVRDVMVQNIEKILERGEKIEILVDKTDSLNQSAFAFKKRSTAIRRSMWWKNTKLMVILVLVTIVIIYFLICLGCGFPDWKTCIPRD